MKNIIHIAHARTGHSIVLEMMQSWETEPRWNFIERFEVYPDFLNALYEMGLLGSRDDEDNVVVLQSRDLLNWFASAVLWLHGQGRGLDSRSMNRRMGRYLSILKEGAGITNHIEDKMFVQYDRFIKVKEIRKKVCKHIGGKFTDEKLDFVPNGGGGSSFDKFDYQGKGSKMNTTERYKQILDTDLKDYYIKTLKQYPEVLDLYKEIHKPTGDKLELFNQIKG